MNKLRFKPVLRIDHGGQLLFRICRIMWQQGKGYGGNGSYSAKLSLAIGRRPFSFRRDLYEWDVCLLWVRIHYLRSYGGIFV